MDTWTGIVMAAGKGVRMRSRIPKPLQPLAGRPLVAHSVESLRLAGADGVLVVVAPGTQTEVAAALGGSARVATQTVPLGTADALAAGLKALGRDVAEVVVLNGDTPLVRPFTIKRMVEAHRAQGAAITLLTATVDNPGALGRVLRQDGRVVAVVEAAEADPETLAVHEINAGAYVFHARWAREALGGLKPGVKGEYYLTGLFALAREADRVVAAVPAEDSTEAMGVNTLVDLADAARALRSRLCREWMLRGVNIVDPAATYLDVGVEMGEDTVLHPGTHLRGATRIGAGCSVGPNAVIADSVIGDGCVVGGSLLEGATLEPQAEVGFFCHLRPGAYLETGVHLGNFVEVKKSRLARGVQAGHFSYLGDATVGQDVNIGAGTITCNFDGVNKNPTIIEEGAFIGSDTMLVAPVRVGARAVTGAGAVVREDVAPGDVVVGVPAKPIRRKRRRRS